MYFLVDFENVRNLGMRGTEFLLRSDCVVLFYSDAAPAIEQRHLNNIQLAGCGFETCKLLKKRKNGLDFYIASKAGALFGAERCQNLVIVSNDSGFQAVRDYWQDRSGTKHRVALSESIEHGILAANENSERANLIRSYRKNVDIGNFDAAYQENIKLRRALEAAFEGTEYSGRLQEIQELLRPGTSPKIIYLDSLKRFGRKAGQEVYRLLKTCAGL
jgi:hypothetical protein